MGKHWWLLVYGAAFVVICAAAGRPYRKVLSAGAVGREDTGGSSPSCSPVDGVRTAWSCTACGVPVTFQDAHVCVALQMSDEPPMLTDAERAEALRIVRSEPGPRRRVVTRYPYNLRSIETRAFGDDPIGFAQNAAHETLAQDTELGDAS